MSSACQDLSTARVDRVRESVKQMKVVAETALQLHHKQNWEKREESKCIFLCLCDLFSRFFLDSLCLMLHDTSFAFTILFIRNMQFVEVDRNVS